MARNAIESEFRTSKMDAGGHFVKSFKKKFRIDLKWPEMPSKVNFAHPKWPKISKKNKRCVSIWNGQKCHRKYWSKMARNAIESEFRTFKMAAGSHFVKQNHKINIVVLIWNGKKWFFDIQNGYRRPFFLKHLQKKLREWFEQCSKGLLADYNLR